MEVRTWKREIILTSLIVVIASYLLFIPPIIGVADQGDYYRLISQVGIRQSPAGTSYDNYYNCWLTVPWNLVSASEAQPNPIRTFSIGEYFAKAAILVHSLLGGGTPWISAGWEQSTLLSWRYWSSSFFD